MEDLRIPGDQTAYKVGKILCIGRNYAQHAREMNADIPDSPVVFLKPATALTRTGSDMIIPALSREVHYEVELVALIGKRGKHIAPEHAMDYVAGYAAGLDMTARDLQSQAKKAGLPWSVAKGFDTFAPLGDLVAAEGIDPGNLAIRLNINGREVQSGHTSDMLFPVDRLVSWCSTVFTLDPGDLIYTGTPKGVGPVRNGDELVARIQGLPELRVAVRDEVR